MSKLVILGAGTFAAELTDIVNVGDHYYVEAYVVNDNNEPKNNLCGRPVFWITYLESITDAQIICGTVQPGRKLFIEQAKQYFLPFAIVIHPSANLSTNTIEVGEGAIIGRGAIVSAYSKIGQHVVINRGANIGHNITVEDYVVIGPGVNIAGNVTIKEGARIGIGATILENITIGENAVVGAGAVVTKDIPAGVKAIGVPARWT